MPRNYDPDWVIEDDEFHPDAGQAAAHADRRALEFTADWLGRRVKRLLTLERPLTRDESKELDMRRAELAHVNDQLKEDE